MMASPGAMACMALSGSSVSMRSSAQACDASIRSMLARRRSSIPGLSVEFSGGILFLPGNGPVPPLIEGKPGWQRDFPDGKIAADTFWADTPALRQPFAHGLSYGDDRFVR